MITGMENEMSIDSGQGRAQMQAASTSGTSVEVSEVSKRFESDSGVHEALRNVSFKVENRQFVSLLGPSGCGKSTLLHIVAGLTAHDEGQVTVAGGPPKEGRRDVGIMMQKPVLLPWRSIIKNVLLPAEALKLDRAESRERALHLLEDVGLGGRADAKAWELSGGMQQRASLARLLLPDPDILLMDEPFAALDEFTRERLMDKVADLHERGSRSALYVTHNIPEAIVLSDRIVVMGPSPGSVLATVDVDLPRPRHSSMLYEARTGELAAEIRGILSGGLNGTVDASGLEV